VKREKGKKERIKGRKRIECEYVNDISGQFDAHSIHHIKQSISER